MVIGTSVMFFSLWSVIKTVFLDFFMRESITDSLLARIDASFGDEYRPYVFKMYLIYTGSLLLLDLAMRLIVGLGARSEGLKKKNRWIYLIFCFFLVIEGLVYLLTFFDNEDIFNNDTIDRAITFFIELTSDLVLLDLLFSGIRVKLIRRKLRRCGETGGRHAD